MIRGHAKRIEEVNRRMLQAMPVKNSASKKTIVRKKVSVVEKPNLNDNLLLMDLLITKSQFYSGPTRKIR